MRYKKEKTENGFVSISDSSLSFAKSKLDSFDSSYCSVSESTEKTWTNERHNFVLF